MIQHQEKVIELLTSKRKAFIGSLKNEITVANSQGFRDGLDYAIETINSVSYSENNGWTKIESEDDLPKEEIRCIVGRLDGKNFVYGYEDEKHPDQLKDLFKCGEITHFRITEKLPPPPIY